LEKTGKGKNFFGKTGKAWLAPDLKTILRNDLIISRIGVTP